MHMLTVLVVTAVLCGCGPGAGEVTTQPSETQSIRVVDNAFEPEAASVRVGDTVTWQWRGDDDHNVVFDDVESPVQSDGQFAHRFDAPGTYVYRCTLHGGMTGTVVVAAPATNEREQ